MQTSKLPAILSGVGSLFWLVGCSGPLETTASSQADLSQSRFALESVDVSTDGEHCQYVRYEGRRIWACTAIASVGPRSGQSQRNQQAESGEPLAINWGVCGITKVQGNAGADGVVRILVDPSGHYQLLVAVGSPSVNRLSARMTCAPTTAFTGVPDAQQAKLTREYSVHSHDAAEPNETLVFRKIQEHGGEASDLCVWSGFEGNVNAVPPGDYESFLFAGSRFDSTHGWSTDAITFGGLTHNFKSFARCDGYAPGHAWSYANPEQAWDSRKESGVFAQYPYSESGALVPGASHLCWFTGISTYGPSMSAELKVDVPREGGDPKWLYKTQTTSTMVGIQCVNYDQ